MTNSSTIMFKINTAERVELNLSITEVLCFFLNTLKTKQVVAESTV